MFRRIAAGSAVVVVAALLPAQPAAAVDSHTRYVALGDSFASGEGASSFQADSTGPDAGSGTSTGCHRSPTSWAGSVALHLNLTRWGFAACSGAMVEDLYNPNSDSKYPAEERPQMHAVDPTVTEVVTLSIGGNDGGFSDVLKACVFGGSGAEGETGCSAQGRFIVKLTEERLNALSSGIEVPGSGSKTLAAVYLDVAQRVKPGGQVVVAGYPHLFGPNRNFYRTGPYNRPACLVGSAVGGFGGYYWVDYEDAQWINGQTDRGNTIIKRQVALANQALRDSRSRTVVKYAAVVDRDRGFDTFSGHSLCDRGDSWINGVQIDTRHRTRKQTSFHPNYNGQRAYAGVVVRAIG
jgi:lysophospholipase L1-like esterase